MTPVADDVARKPALNEIREFNANYDLSAEQLNITEQIQTSKLEVNLQELKIENESIKQRLRIEEEFGR